jgi:hypothetical protein
MKRLGIIGPECRITNLRGLTLYAHAKLLHTPFPASECRFGSCITNCCMHGCRVCYEDVVDLGPYMAEIAATYGIKNGGLSLNFVGEADEPGYERNRGFVKSLTRTGCVFLDPEDQGCRLHRVAMERGLPWRKMKPFTCVLYPVRMKHIAMPDGPAIALKPSKEHSICKGLTHLREVPQSAKSFYDVKAEDIAILFDLGG